jgi:uncharacterized protein YjbI with pentapeptide repeats
LAYLEWTGRRPGSFWLEACLSEPVPFTASEFGSSIWEDVRLVGCDLANVRAHRIDWGRIELVNLRLIGLAARAAKGQDVLIEDSDARSAQLLGGVLQRCEFLGSDVLEAVSREADLGSAVLRGCPLTRADLR